MTIKNFSRFCIAADHGGLELKNKVLGSLSTYPWKDLGTNSTDSVDYPDFAKRLIEHIKPNDDMGVLICGSGQGMAIRANRAPHIRAALCWTPEVARLAREHNDANVLCLGGRHLDHDVALEIVESFITSQFEGGRHARLVGKRSYCE